MKVAYLGPEGSYSHLAAKTFLKEQDTPIEGMDECMPFRNATEVMSAVVENKVDCAVVPIANCLQGGVLQNLDLLQSSKDIYAVGELILRIDHRLVYKEGMKLSEIDMVYSHLQALGQCSAFLAKQMPFATLKDSDSTACGLGLATEDESGKSAAIVGSHTENIRTGFVMSEECISDEKNNFTQFLVLKKGVENLPKTANRMFFSAVCPHHAGSLLELLKIISDYGVSMTKIESRPVKNAPGEYRFFIEADCDISSQAVAEMLERIKENTIEYKLLGVYLH